jgi:phosphoserine phosphatase RsbU/P
MRRKIELSALLEVTQAINANIPEEDLYRVFYFTCISNLQLSEIALLVVERGKFVEKFAHEISFTTADLLQFESEEFDLQKVQKIHPSVSQIFQVKHKQKTLAILILGHQKAEEVEESYSFLQILSNIVLVAIENKRLARQALVQERNKKEIEIARSVQEMLIPNQLPNNQYFQAVSTYLPFQMVGGDYYDVIKVGENYMFCIADVSGKGVPAALIMSNFQASLRSLCKVTHDVEQIIQDLNIQLIENARSDHFVTCFLAHFDVSTKALTYVNAGHNPPYLITNKECIPLQYGCFMLGIFDDMPSDIKQTIEIKQGNSLFMFTDGITETLNNFGDEFGEKRLMDFLLTNKQTDMHLAMADLIVEVDTFKEDQDYRDDLTMLDVKFK